MMSVHVDNIFMTGKTETINNIYKNSKREFNISESRKVRKFIGVYCEGGCYMKGMYAKMTMDKDVKKLVEDY